MGGVNATLCVSGCKDCEDQAECQDGLQTPAAGGTESSAELVDGTTS